MAKINFPKPATDGQLYPDLDAGDLPLADDTVYIYDGVLGVWKITCDPDSELLGEDPIVIETDSYSDDIQTVIFDPNPLPRITKK